MTALGLDRTLEQDAAFCIRVMVDVAIRALSAAINDPTTAVQVLYHLEDLRRLIGSTPLRGQMTFQDGSGTSRLVIPGRKWEDHPTPTRSAPDRETTGQGPFPLVVAGVGFEPT